MPLGVNLLRTNLRHFYYKCCNEKQNKLHYKTTVIKTILDRGFSYIVLELRKIVLKNRV